MTEVSVCEPCTQDVQEYEEIEIGFLKKDMYEDAVFTPLFIEKASYASLAVVSAFFALVFLGNALVLIPASISTYYFFLCFVESFKKIDFDNTSERQIHIQKIAQMSLDKIIDIYTMQIVIGYDLFEGDKHVYKEFKSHGVEYLKSRDAFAKASLEIDYEYHTSLYPYIADVMDYESRSDSVRALINKRKNQGGSAFSETKELTAIEYKLDKAKKIRDDKQAILEKEKNQQIKEHIDLYEADTKRINESYTQRIEILSSQHKSA